MYITIFAAKPCEPCLVYIGKKESVSPLFPFSHDLISEEDSLCFNIFLLREKSFLQKQNRNKETSPGKKWCKSKRDFSSVHRRWAAPLCRGRRRLFWPFLSAYLKRPSEAQRMTEHEMRDISTHTKIAISELQSPEISRASNFKTGPDNK